ncbi:MAG: hypothetical protein U5R06_00980 [candidate division KSB1 bacterium]|nr:hypothetical protein [candidate division KSB1 bacterium]
MGKCPECGNKIGPLSIIMSWEKWGEFQCPECGSQIRFKYWLLTGLLLMGLFTGAERILHWMLISPLPLWASFAISFVLALLIMMLVPMIWEFQKTKH